MFLLTFWQRVFHGPKTGAAAGSFADATGGELAVLVPLAALMLLLGILPQILTAFYNPLITTWAGLLPPP